MRRRRCAIRLEATPIRRSTPTHDPCHSGSLSMRRLTLSIMVDQTRGANICTWSLPRTLPCLRVPPRPAPDSRSPQHPPDYAFDSASGQWSNGPTPVALQSQNAYPLPADADTHFRQTMTVEKHLLPKSSPATLNPNSNHSPIQMARRRLRIFALPLEPISQTSRARVVSPVAASRRLIDATLDVDHWCDHPKHARTTTSATIAAAATAKT